MEPEHRKISEITHGMTILTLSYQEAEAADGMTGWFLNLWRRATTDPEPTDGGFGRQVAYKNVIIESNYGKTAEHAVASAVAVINNWLVACSPALDAGKAPTPDEKQVWKANVAALLQKLSFYVNDDGVPQVR